MLVAVPASRSVPLVPAGSRLQRSFELWLLTGAESGDESQGVMTIGLVSAS